ncbi:hypothetical protein F5Y08DRAFT_295515 [Xylaria arbuscula]|nr:hypothetical protein F5Y08DRAFT_295515 [Xylaria arbuscula]
MKHEVAHISYVCRFGPRCLFSLLCWSSSSCDKPIVEMQFPKQPINPGLSTHDGPQVTETSNKGSSVFYRYCALSISSM